MRTFLSSFVIAIFCLSRVADAAPLETEELQAFVAKHCSECHGAKKQEADLRLDTLSHDLNDAATAEAWTKVLERVAAGEMPPEDRPQPDAATTDRILTELGERLAIAAKATAHMQPGRGPRRLNRVEYQRTVNQLLGIDLSLAGLLPEDGTVDGFDKVGRGLNISSVQVEKYLEAADAALDEALIEKPYVSSTKTHLTLWHCNRSRRNMQKNEVWAENDDAVLIYYTNDKFHDVDAFKAPIRGKYRIRVSAYGTVMGEGAKQEDEPVVLAIHGGEFKSTNRISNRVGLFSVEWMQPRVFEAVAVLDEGHTFKITVAGQPPWTYLAHVYKGPALAVQWFTIEGPLDDGTVEQRKEMLFGSVDPAKGTRDDADRLLQQFATRAFRRPASAKDVAPYAALMHAQFDRGASFVEALRIGIKTILCSPQFLFFDQSPKSTDEYSIASRLSYFLWSLPPDAELLGLASAGKLRDPQVRRAQVERMLADPRAEFFTQNFLDGWLELKKIDFTTPDKELYPEFDEQLRDSMNRESYAFFDELLTHDLSVLNVIDSNFAMLNGRLAEHYGIDGVRGDEIRRVDLPQDSLRRGMLTQAAVLKVTADGTVTSPVLRGVWLLDRVMGRPVPPPPPGVPGVEPDIRGATTIRNQLSKHREIGACATCHKKIDPPGFALENFDPIGGWRERYRALDPDKSGMTIDGRQVKYVYGTQVEAGDELADGRRFADVREFKQLLMTDPQPIVENVAARLLTYALGREPDVADRAELRKIVDRVRSNDYGLQSLMKEIVASDVFVSR